MNAIRVLLLLILFIHGLYGIEEFSLECDTDCPADCPYGLANQTINGRCVCICAPDPCKDITCPADQFCKVRFNENCTKPPCKAIDCVQIEENAIVDQADKCDEHCPMDCPFGVTNKTTNGRCICVCAPDPCEGIICPADQICKVRYKSNCEDSTCKTVGCVPMVKAGECPQPDFIKTFEHINCESDSECWGQAKCCPSTSVTTCVRPCRQTACKCASDYKVDYIVSFKGCKVCTCVKKTEEVSETEEDVCSLPKESGLCKGSFQRFYYDNETQECKQFTYGGCPGNGNNFHTIEFCQRRCMRRNHNNLAYENNTNQSVANCFLKKESGMCMAYFKKYFYNSETNRCEEFIYGGCQGNENRFDTIEECNKYCAFPLQSRLIKKPKCYLSQDSGPCRGNFEKYYYNKDLNKCELFTYGGCKGNENRFDTIEECNQECFHSIDYPKNKNKCLLEKDTGNCRGSIERYYYNSKSKNCEKFIFGGCLGNGNNFETKEKCIQQCDNVCSLPREIGPCRAAHPRFFYNITSNRCEKFLYGGCRGNRNNFNREEECNFRCKIQEMQIDKKETVLKDCDKNCTIPLSNHTIEKLNICQLQKEAGPCRGFFERFYFNKDSGKCEQFIYGGCLGNGNNFESIEDCKDECSAKQISKEIKNDSERVDCTSEKDVGMCRGFILRYYFNSTEQTCESFYYGGCGGNRNNYGTENECKTACLEKNN